MTDGTTPLRAGLRRPSKEAEKRSGRGGSSAENALDKFAATVKAAADTEEAAKARTRRALQAEWKARAEARLIRVHAALTYLKDRKITEAKYRTYGEQGPLVTDAADRVGEKPGTVRDWFEAAFVLVRLRRAKIRALEILSATSLGYLTRLRKQEWDQLRIARDAINEGLTTRQVKARVDAALRKAGPKQRLQRTSAAPTVSLGATPSPEERQQVLAVLTDLAGAHPVEERKEFLAALLAEFLDALDADDWGDCKPTGKMKPVHRALVQKLHEPNLRLPEAARVVPVKVRVGPRSWVTIYDGDGWERACDPEVAVHHLEALPTAPTTPSGIFEQRQRVVAAVESAAEESWEAWRAT